MRVLTISLAVLLLTCKSLSGKAKQDPTLFVFSIGGVKQNVNSLLTPVSGTVFHALSHGSLHFVLHGSLINCLFQRFLLAVEENQPIKKWLKKLP